MALLTLCVLLANQLGLEAGQKGLWGKACGAGNATCQSKGKWTMVLGQIDTQPPRWKIC